MCKLQYSNIDIPLVLLLLIPIGYSTLEHRVPNKRTVSNNHLMGKSRLYGSYCPKLDPATYESKIPHTS